VPLRPIGKIKSSSGSLVWRSSGRRVSGIGALIVAFAAVPAWWTLGGGTIPEISGNAFDSPGAIGFFAALAVLGILVAPEAVGADLPIDRWPVHLTLVTATTIAFIVATTGTAVSAVGSNTPLSLVFGITRAPGLWLTLLGLGVWISGVALIVDARDDR
jgi:hypothetical protein